MQLHKHITGTAVLTTEHGRTVSGTFILEQYLDGHLFLQCTCDDPLAGWSLYGHHVTDVRGQTSDGELLTTKGPYHVESLDGPVCTIIFPHASIGDTSKPAVVHRFALTNLFLPSSQAEPTTLTLLVENEPLTVQLVPDPAYAEREQLSRRSRLPTVTVALVISAPAQTVDWITSVAHDLCYALSIVQGHKVNWITHEGTDADCKLNWRTLNAHVTKRFSALPLDYQSGSRSRLPLTFVPTCFTHVRQRDAQYHWNKRLIDSWLEARTDTDYVEARALKCVVVLETLRTIVLRDGPPRDLLGPAQWENFLAYALPQVRLYLRAEMKVAADTVASLTDPQKWRWLNRKSFRSDLSVTFKRLGMPRPQYLDWFIESRNKLIHEGTFRCIADKATLPGEAPQNPTDEYLFIASFVDRVIMHVFGLNPPATGDR
jgi:hypothetical protein